MKKTNKNTPTKVSILKIDIEQDNSNKKKENKQKSENKFISIGLTLLLFIVLTIFFGIASSLNPYDSVSYIVAYFMTLGVIIKFYKKDIIDDFKRLKRDFKKHYKDFIPVSTICIILVYVINYCIFQIVGTESGNQIAAIDELKSSVVLISIYTILLAPFVEEFIFKLPFKHHKKKRIIDLFIISTLFTLMHFYPETNPLAYLYLISYFVLSIGIAYPFYKTDNILLSILVHIINNLINVMIILF